MRIVSEEACGIQKVIVNSVPRFSGQLCPPFPQPVRVKRTKILPLEALEFDPVCSINPELFSWLKCRFGSFSSRNVIPLEEKGEILEGTSPFERDSHVLLLAQAQPS